MPSPESSSRPSQPLQQRTNAATPPESHDPLGPLDGPDRSRLAMVASCSVHFVVIMLLGLFSGRPPAGTGAGDERPIGIAMVHRRPDRDRYQEVAERPDLSVDDAMPTTENGSRSAAAAASSAPPTAAAPIDLAAALANITASPTPGTGDGPTGSAAIIGQGDVGLAKSGSGPSAPNATATTSVFGISGSGSSFVYVFDRSDSMNGFGGRPLRAAKRELIKSLQSLTDRQQFSILFYNDRPKPFSLGGVSRGLVTGDEVSVKAARSYIDSIRAYGGTEHGEAIRLALNIGPDVIFFLTDASLPRLSESQMRTIRRAAERSGTTIHAIEFGATPAASPNSFLKELANMAGGQYRYVNVQSLP